MDYQEVLNDILKKNQDEQQDFDNETKTLLLREDIVDYIINNNSNTFILQKIANSDSLKLRDKYFSCENVKLLGEIFKRIMTQKPYSPNKVKLLDKDYILDILTTCPDSFIKFIAENEKGTQIIIKLFNYYINDISKNKEILRCIINKLPEDVRIELFRENANTIDAFCKENEEFEFDYLFGYIDSLEYAINLIEIFDKMESFSWSNKFLEEIINSFYISFPYGEESPLKNNEKLKEFFWKDKIKATLLSNSIYETPYRELLKIYGEEFIDRYFDSDGIRIADEHNHTKNVVNTVIGEAFNIDALIENQIILEFFSSKNLNDLDRYLERNSKITKSLLKCYLEVENYNAFYKVFSFLDNKSQMDWIGKNKESFIIHLEKSFEVFKGLKKDGYNIFKDYYQEEYRNFEFSEYELKRILDNYEKGEESDYSYEQFEIIFTNRKNMEILLGTSKFGEIFLRVLNLNKKEVSKAYLDDWFIKRIIEEDKLEAIFTRSFLSSKYELKHNKREFFTNKIILDEVREKSIENYNYHVENRTIEDIYYSTYFSEIRRLKNEELLFEILDYLVENEVFNGFALATDSNGAIEEETVSKYYSSRRDLITKVINESQSGMIGKLFTNLRGDNLKREIFKERECIINHLNYEDFTTIFKYGLDGSYKISPENVDVDSVMKIFGGDSYDLLKNLNCFLDDKNLIEEIYNKVLGHEKIISAVSERLNDTVEQYEIYLDIIESSSYFDSLTNEEKKFLMDMRTLIIERDYRSSLALWDEYQNAELEEIKLAILEKVKNQSRQNIISSLTDLDKFDKKIQSYKFGEKVYNIPTIIFDGQPYNFIIRTLDSGRHYLDGSFRDKTACYSTIFQENRSAFYGNTKVKFGYSNIRPEDIEYVYPFDAISNNFHDHKYYPKGLKRPLWLSADELNRVAKRNRSYDELRIKGFYLPDFVVSYDEPNEKSVVAADTFDATMVKILRKSYPNSIEYTDDPYSNWQ